jgi:hypothetical protein
MSSGIFLEENLLARSTLGLDMMSDILGLELQISSFFKRNHHGFSIRSPLVSLCDLSGPEHGNMIFWLVYDDEGMTTCCCRGRLTLTLIERERVCALRALLTTLKCRQPPRDSTAKV